MKMIGWKEFKYIFLYGVILAVLILALKWLQWKFLIVDNAIDIYIGMVVLFFTILGVWVAMQLIKPKIRTVFIEKKVEGQFPINQDELAKLNLSLREYEVLQSLSKGHSNADIANHLFLSLSTVKTHVSNLYGKLEVKSRTQALEKARRLKIIH